MNLQPLMHSPGTASLQTLTHGKSLHVIASQCAHLWQSVTPAAAENEKQYLGRIRSSLRIRPKCYFFLAFSAGRGLPRRGAAAPLLAMTCRRWMRACGCKGGLQRTPWAGDADCHTSSPQSPPCSPPAKGQRGSNAPLRLISPQRAPLRGAPCTGSQ